MTKFHVAQNNFNGGVLGSLLQDRYDLPSYNNSLKAGQNAFPLTEGPLAKRPGSIYIDTVLNNAKGRLIEFKFSKDKKFMLEFTPNKIRVFKDRSYSGVSIDTDLTDEMYEDIYTAQLSDLLLMVSNKMPPKQLKRTSDTEWSITNIEFYDGPYGETNTTNTELYCSDKTGRVNLNATADIFSDKDIGRHWRLRVGDGWSWGICVGYNNARQIVIDVKEGSMPISPYQTKLWKKGLFSNSDGNYPSCICLDAKRLWLGGFPNNPSTIVASKTSDFFNFAPADISTTAVSENNSITLNLSASGVSDVQFIAAADKGLDIGTSGGIWIIDTSAGFVTQDVSAKLKNSQGAAHIKPIVTGPSVVYVQRSTKKIMDIQYSFTEDGYNAPELSLFNRDYMKNGLIDIKYQQDPMSCLWCLDSHGKVYSMNYDKEQSVYAWFEQNYGDKVESIATLPSVDGSSEDVWLIVNRKVGNRYVRYIEYMPSLEEMRYIQRDSIVYSDCAKIQNYNIKTNVLTGLDYLEGREIAVLGDGNHFGIYEVENGSVTLAKGVEVNKAVVGIVNEMQLNTITHNYGFTNGTTLHRKKEICSIKIGLLESLGGDYNLDGSDKYYPIVFFNSSVNLDTNVPLFTGIKCFDARPLNDEYATIYIRHRQGLPFIVTSITFDMENA